MAKIQKHLFLSNLLFSKDFMDENVENVQQRMNSLSNRVVRGDKSIFVKKKKHRHNDPKIVKKNENFFQFLFFNAIFVKYSAFS